MEVGIGEDELGQGPWEEEGSGKCIFLPLNWIHSEALPQTSVVVKRMGPGARLLGFESELGHLLGQITLCAFLQSVNRNNNCTYHIRLF